MSHCCLSVNVNKIATLRNSRGKNLPNLIETTLDIVNFGAHGITVHPRPDERHIHRKDVYELKKYLTTTKHNIELNVEGFPSEDFMNLIDEVRPAQATLVPDPPNTLTSNAGWNVEQQEQLLCYIVERLKKIGIRSSIFIDPADMNDEAFRSLERISCDRIELYTEAYAEIYDKLSKLNEINKTHCRYKVSDKIKYTGTSYDIYEDNKNNNDHNKDSYKDNDNDNDNERDNNLNILSVYKTVAYQAHKLGFGINAGHDLNYKNLPLFLKTIPIVKEVSIGHALICDALTYGLEKTINLYLDAIKNST